MHILDFVLLRVVLVSVFVNAYVNGLDNQTNILCTKISGWKDAMISCLLEGGIPLNHDDIKNVNLSEKINLTVWTAEYIAISNQTRNSSADLYSVWFHTCLYWTAISENCLDVIRNTMCGSQTIHVDKQSWGAVIDKVTNIKYKNCTEQQAYVCKNEDNTNQWQVYLNQTTWRNAETSCESKNQRLPTAIQLQNGNYIPAVVPGQSESLNLEVWIGLVASLDRRTVQSKPETGNLQGVHVVKYGIYVSLARFRMIDEYLPDEFTALCSFESLKSVRQSLFTDCLKDTGSLYITMASLDVISTGEMTRKTPKVNQESSENGLATIVIAIATIAVIIGCIVTVILVLYFYRKRHTRKEANSGTGQFTYDDTSQARVFQSRQDNTADGICDHNEADKEANYEVIPDNIQTVYVNDRVEGHHEAYALVSHESVYVNNTPEAHYEVAPDNIQPVYVNETEEGRYEALIQLKESVYVNKTPEGHYEKLAKDNTESVYFNE